MKADLLKEEPPLEGFFDVVGVPVGKATRGLIPRKQKQYIYKTFDQIQELLQGDVWVVPAHRLLH